MRYAGGSFKSMGSSAVKTGDTEHDPPQGEDLIAGDKNFTKNEQREDARLESKNNDAAAQKEYMEMMAMENPTPNKMKGNPMDFIRSQKLKGDKVLKGENPHTFPNQRNDNSTKEGLAKTIDDLEMRIQDVQDDIDESPTGPTQDQKSTLRALKAALKKLKA
mgnify:CR=1 FL=1